MKRSELKRISVLGLSPDLDLLQTLGVQLSRSFPQSWFDKANNFYMGVQYLASYTYDSIILDVKIFESYELMVRALDRNIPLLVLMDSNRAPICIEQFIALKARAVIQKSEIYQITVAAIIGKIVRSGKTYKRRNTSRCYRRGFFFVLNPIFGGKIKKERGSLVQEATL